jgi:hypothetical protein
MENTIYKLIDVIRIVNPADHSGQVDVPDTRDKNNQKQNDDISGEEFRDKLHMVASFNVIYKTSMTTKSFCGTDLILWPTFFFYYWYY